MAAWCRHTDGGLEVCLGGSRRRTPTLAQLLEHLLCPQTLPRPRSPRRHPAQHRPRCPSTRAALCGKGWCSHQVSPLERAPREPLGRGRRRPGAAPGTGVRCCLPHAVSSLVFPPRDPGCAGLSSPTSQGCLLGCGRDRGAVGAMTTSWWQTKGLWRSRAGCCAVCLSLGAAGR